MRPELEACLMHLDDIEISEQEKRELIKEVFKITQVFAQIGFGSEATQYALLAKQMNHGKKPKDSVRFKHTLK